MDTFGNKTNQLKPHLFPISKLSLHIASKCLDWFNYTVVKSLHLVRLLDLAGADDIFHLFESFCMPNG